MDLVNFAAHVPVTYKQRGPVGKWVLKKAMEPSLPHAVIYRPLSRPSATLSRKRARGRCRGGHDAPLARLRERGRGRGGDLLSAESLKRRGVFEPVAV